jgi:hypothetical protein
MHRRTLISTLFTAFAVLVATLRHSVAWVLVTQEEFEHDSIAPHNEAAPAAAQPGAPSIKVEEPDPAKPIKPPVTIRISFEPQGDATIDPSSFRATYGWLGIDITQRIVQHAKVSASGLVATNADVPPGTYRVTLQIADNRHRVGVRVFEFTVV